MDRAHNKKCACKLIFLNKHFFRKFRMVFDIGNWLWNQIFAFFDSYFAILQVSCKKQCHFLCHFCVIFVSFLCHFLCHFCAIFVISKIRASIWNVFYQIPLTWCKTYHRVRSFLSIECLTPWPRSMAIRSRIARRSIRSWHSSLSWAKFSLKLLLMPAKLRKFVIKVRSPFSTNRSLDMVENRPGY